MDTKELRLGCWIQGDMGIPHRVRLSDFADWYNDHNSHEIGNHIHPILLTEEWMLKFGAIRPSLRPPFDYDRSASDPDYELEYYTANYDLNGVYFEEFENVLFFEGVMKNIVVARSKEDNHYYFVEEKTAADESQYLGKISAPIAFVHTFQNYFPAFSGEELKIQQDA